MLNCGLYFPCFLNIGYIPPSLGPNIKIMDWLPQNDLLAHPKTRALVSHVGHNSLYEAAYRGVPVVAVPLTGDQPGNARKAEHLGFAVAVQLSTTSAEELFQAIERVIQEPRYCVLPFLLGFCSTVIILKNSLALVVFVPCLGPNQTKFGRTRVALVALFWVFASLFLLREISRAHSI